MKDPVRVTNLTKFWNRFLRSISRNEWTISLMGLPRTDAEQTEPGLVLIQIDGLSRTQLQKALEQGNMPFLKRLLEKESYRNYKLYSGLPASTPGVQAELYYGKKTAVPAFGFRNHETGQLDRMFENSVASRVENELTKTGDGLLKGGSSYCNIYSGGASEQHYCATSFGWSEFFQAANPLRIFLFLLLHFWMFIRVLFLLFIEFALAIGGFFRGVFSGRNFFQELLMIPARVIIVVLLRELITTGACSDVARGQPIVHLNYLGYDEQAHRRGPGSWFAHWALAGIDRSIRRIWNAAHLGAGRDYDLWVFSDHGQEETTPYQKLHGKLVQEEVARIVDQLCQPKEVPDDTPSTTRLPTRAHWLGLGWLVTIFFGEQDHDMQNRSNNVQTVTSGDLGFVYLLTEEAARHREQVARELVDEANVPMVILRSRPGHATAVTPDGIFQLPSDGQKLFDDTPQNREKITDLIQLAHHADSGEMLLVGWNGQQDTVSFVIQNGAHAGPGPEETGAFALIPNDISIGNSSEYLRPNDIRLAAYQFLGETNGKAGPSETTLDGIEESSENMFTFRRPEDPQLIIPSKPSISDLSIMSYNVHACVGMDGDLSPRRIARVIAQSGAAIICLQEVDVNRKRSGNRDQVHEIARYLAMEHAFFPAWHIEEEKFGNAILSRYPLSVMDAKGLHHHKEDRSRRSALWASVDLGSQKNIQIINTHLSIFPQERLIQSKELVEKWITPANELGPVVLCGDFNALPSGKTHRTISLAMKDVEDFTKLKTRPTYFSPYPMARLDHIFVTSELVPTRVEVIDSRLARVASDHRPLMTTLDFKDHASADSPEDSSRQDLANQ